MEEEEDDVNVDADVDGENIQYSDEDDEDGGNDHENGVIPSSDTRLHAPAYLSSKLYDLICNSTFMNT